MWKRQLDPRIGNLIPSTACNLPANPQGSNIIMSQGMEHIQKSLFAGAVFHQGSAPVFNFHGVINFN